MAHRGRSRDGRREHAAGSGSSGSASSSSASSGSASSSSASSTPKPSTPTEVVYGLRAGLAVLTHRPDAVVRIAYSRDLRDDLHEVLRWAADERVPAEEVPDTVLDDLAASTHHEGFCVTTEPRPWLSPNELVEMLVRTGGTALALDRVRNPYNIGAILRSAGFFGVDAALLGAPAPHPGLPPMAVRVAEGGVEPLRLARTTDLADTLARCRARGIHVVGADGAAETSAFEAPWPRPSILVLGNEREGLGDRVRAQCDTLVAIPGTGAVESLNVAVAAGVLIAELTRRRDPRPTRTPEGTRAPRHGGAPPRDRRPRS